MHLVAVERGPERRQTALDRARRAGLGRLGRGVSRRRRDRDRLDAVRAGRALPARLGAARRTAVGRCRARHVRLHARPREPVGHAVALPGRDRGRARQEGGCARDVRLPVPGGRVPARAVLRPPHGLPARFSVRLRLRDRARPGASRAGAARARRPAAGRRGHAGEGAQAREGSVLARACASR